MQNYEELAILEEEYRFGNISVLFNRLNPQQKVMQKVLSCSSLKEFQEVAKTVQVRQSLDSPHLLQLLKTFLNPNTLEIKAVYEYPENSVRMESLSRDLVFQFVDNMLRALCYLHKKQLIHGDLRPCFISFDQTNKSFKLLDWLGNKESFEQVQKKNVQSYKPLYIAPKMFEGLIKQSWNLKYKAFKSELFSLGMIVLEMFEDLEEIQTVYDYQK